MEKLFQAPCDIGCKFRGMNIIRYVLGMMAMLYSIGFWLSDPPYHPNYSALFNIMPSAGWGVALGIYGLIKFVSGTTRLPNILPLMNSLDGLWVWLYTVFSFIVFDITPLGAAEVVLLAPVILELADTSNILWNVSHKSRKSNIWYLQK